MCEQRKYHHNTLSFLQQCGNYGVGGDYIPHMDRNSVDGRGTRAVGDLVATVVTILQSPSAGIMIMEKF